VTYVNVNGETGLTFHVGDADGLAEACNRLLSDTVLRERLGENARRRTLGKFSYTAMREAAVPFFQRLCGGSGMKNGGNEFRGTG
jgi:glycosyltransferase involved in cell wall biosynthesis